MFSNWFQYLGGAFLGWSLGANDSANVFGTAVSSRMVSYRLAVILTAVFIVIGALMQGEAGIRTLSKDLKKGQAQSVEKMTVFEKRNYEAKLLRLAMISSFSAALTVTMMTILKIPVSTSQAVVGAIIGIAAITGDVDLGGLGKVVICWLGTPVGAAIFAIIFYYLFHALFRRLNLSLFTYDPVITILLIVCGCYGAYALGANNVANISAVFVGEGMLTVHQAAVFGSISIVVGVVTFSKPVMMTVGKGIVKLDSFTAFIAVLAHAVTVHMYAIIGVPVSTSQAIVGAVLGIGLIKGIHTINYKMLVEVSAGWTATPFIAGIISAAGYFVANLKYSP